MTDIKKRDIGNARLFVGLEGAQVECLNPKTGEINWQVGFAPGIHFMSQLRDNMVAGEILRVEGQATVINNGSRLRCQPHPAAYQSGASTDYVPSVATEQEVRMRKLLKEVNESSSSLDRKMKAYAKMAQSGEVIEKEETTDGKEQAPEKGTKAKETGAETESPVPLQEVNKEGAE
ncbi:hypothetical protein [Tritonibacter mobilis]|uniref:hypothetical protein n=1 Tax=Tritonibacter mobilis TaxID=379347 RepID=UPI001402EA47|nr:hypothetical protein [Tritonibacter mobilis]NHM20312.1 hypothetical protein [Tritonibacter mobilis]NHM24476.1 hypothetical protein [Tritonibacter mobilis]